MSSGKSYQPFWMVDNKEFTQGFGRNFEFFIPDEPPADCQDCTRALDWCAEYKALNRENAPYNRGGCRSYRGGRKGYENPVQCEHCGTVYPSDKFFHPYKDGVICCKHFGHEPGSCIVESGEK